MDGCRWPTVQSRQIPRKYFRTVANKQNKSKNKSRKTKARKQATLIVRHGEAPAAGDDCNSHR